MPTRTLTTEKGSPHDAPRKVQVIMHSKVFTFAEGWNEVENEPGIFAFEGHGFNFDYLLHLSGINYLIHPADISEIIWMVQEGAVEPVEFNFRFISRTGEVRSLQGVAKLVAAA